MIRKLALALPALVLVLASARSRARRLESDRRRSGRHGDLDPPRHDLAAHRHGLRVRLGRARRGRVLQVRQRERRRATAARSRTRSSTTRTTRRRPCRPTRKLVEQDKVFAIFNALGTEHNRRDPRLPEREQGAAALRRLGRDEVRHGRGEVPVHDRLPAELPGRGLGARQVPRAHAGPGAKVAVLFQNDDYGKDLLVGLKRGHPALEGEGRRRRAVRGDRVRRAGAGREAQGVRRGHVRDLRRRRSSRSSRTSSRTGSAGSRSSSINNAVSSASNIMLLASEGGTNKVVNGSVSIVFLKDPTDPKWRNDAGDEALPAGHEAVRAGRERERRLPRLRHGRGLDGRRGAQEGRART